MFWSPRFKADDHSAFGFAAGTGVVFVLPFFFFVFFFGAASAGAACSACWTSASEAINTAEAGTAMLTSNPAREAAFDEK